MGNYTPLYMILRPTVKSSHLFSTAGALPVFNSVRGMGRTIQTSIHPEHIFLGVSNVAVLPPSPMTFFCFTYLREDKKKGELTQAELIILNFRLDLIPLNLTFIFHSVADSFSGCYCESCVPTLAKAVKYQSCCKILSSARKYFFSPEVGIGICFGATGNVLLS